MPESTLRFSLERAGDLTGRKAGDFVLQLNEPRLGALGALFEINTLVLRPTLIVLTPVLIEGRSRPILTWCLQGPRSPACHVLPPRRGVFHRGHAHRYSPVQRGVDHALNFGRFVFWMKDTSTEVFRFSGGVSPTINPFRELLLDWYGLRASTTLY